MLHVFTSDMCKNKFPIKLSKHGFNEKHSRKMAPFLFANVPVRNHGWKEQNNLLCDSGEVLKGQKPWNTDIICVTVENPVFPKRN